MFNDKKIKELESRINYLEKDNELIRSSVLGYKTNYFGQMIHVESLPNIRDLVDMMMEHLDVEYQKTTTNPCKLVKKIKAKQ